MDNKVLEKLSGYIREEMMGVIVMLQSLRELGVNEVEVGVQKSKGG